MAEKGLRRVRTCSLRKAWGTWGYSLNATASAGARQPQVLREPRALDGLGFTFYYDTCHLCHMQVT